MGTLQTLANRMRDKITVIGAEGNLAAIRAGEAALRVLVTQTPADVSTALSDWQVGIGIPVRNSIPAYVPGKGGSTERASASQAFRVGVAKMQKKKPGITIFISNNTTYIEKLDVLGGRRKGGGFVARANKAAQMSVRTRKRKNG